MNETLWVVLLVGTFAVAILWGYWVTRKRVGYLWACYALMVAWIGAVLVGLARTGSTHTAALLGVGIAVLLPFMFARDKRRVLGGGKAKMRQDAPAQGS